MKSSHRFRSPSKFAFGSLIVSPILAWTYRRGRITQLMYDFLETPDDFYKHLRRVTASIACTLVFGQRGATYDTFWGHVSIDSKLLENSPNDGTQCVYDALKMVGSTPHPPSLTGTGLKLRRA